MILLAICDAKYCYTMVDIGAYGRDNDAAILNASTFGRAFSKGNFHLPEMSEIDPKVPPVLVGDDTFALKPWLMQPYPGKNLNVQLFSKEFLIIAYIGHGEQLKIVLEFRLLD